MADSQQPQPPAEDRSRRPTPIRLIWRVNAAEDAAEPEVPGLLATRLRGLDYVAGGEPAWVFDVPREKLRAAADRFPEAERTDPRNRLERYAHAFVTYDSAIDPLRAWIEEEKLPESLAVQLEAGSHVPPVRDSRDETGSNGPSAGAASEDFSDRQGYLGDVGAPWCWQYRGGRGDGVSLIDVEEGWNLSHEDLVGQVLPLPGINDIPHGTAVLGIVAAAPDGRGVTGMAHRAQVGCEPTESQTGLYNPEAAVFRAANALTDGLVLIQVQTRGLDNNLLPLEAGDLGWAVVRHAILEGLHVVEPAANGGVELPPLRDSGAILVGAGDPVTRVRLSGSNWGDRVDLQGWGRSVVTTGAANSTFRWRNLTPLAEHNRCYTSRFNGTSSAAAIVAGAVACTDGLARAHGIVLTSGELRDLLVRTGKHPQDDGGEPIGPLPDLQQAVTVLAGEQGLTLQPEP